VAITVWLVGQAAMNMGYVVGLLPVTGVTLPLISAGGTSLVLTLFIIGLLARFARSEPEAIEAQRSRTRGRLARWFLPVPASAVAPVRPRRAPEDRGARPAVRGGRTVVRARPGTPRPVPPRDAPPAAPTPRSAPVGGARAAESPVAPARGRRPAEEPRGRRPAEEPRGRRPAEEPVRGRRPVEEPARGRRSAEPLARRQPPASGSPRRPGGPR
jgi:cell division protein FtsW